MLNGPNLNLLGEREPEVYGRETFSDVEALCARPPPRRASAWTSGRATTRASSSTRSTRCASAAGIVINAVGPDPHLHRPARRPGSSPAPVVEVHIRNVHAREEFRHHSYLSAVSDGVIVGCGTRGYASPSPVAEPAQKEAR